MLGALPPNVALKALLGAIESAGVGCTIILEQNGRLERVYANDAIARTFGCTREEMLERAPMDLLPPSERARLGVMNRALAAGEKGAIALETAVVRPDGTSVPV
ncbi:MAG: PAS domain S-box protein, partial [Gemmatimonadetes bacterium]|nr:PAS domain S-box protein [Gemmatimonadota bacterium]